MSTDGYVGPDAAPLRARDNALCTCGHKSISHGSYVDGVFVGVGAGPCGFDHLTGAESVKHCERFEVAIPAPVSGDLCHFLPGGTGLVEHYRCDDYRDGTITNCITGETVKDAPYSAPRGFVRATPVAEPTNGGE